MRQAAKYYAILGKTTFSPLDLSPALWLDASDTSTITESSGAVSEWRDKSGNARHVSQGTAAKQPTTGTTTLNGRNVIKFDSGDVMRASGATTLDDPVTVFVVFIGPTSPTTNQYIWDGYDVNARHPYAYINQNDNLNIAIGGSTSTPAGYVGGAANAMSVRVDSGSSPTVRFSVNGTASTVAAGGNANLKLISIGHAYTDGSFGLNGSIAEMIVCNALPTAQQLSDVGTYLSNKWGVAP